MVIVLTVANFLKFESIVTVNFHFMCVPHSYLSDMREKLKLGESFLENKVIYYLDDPLAKASMADEL